jgi:hypothetical protein
MRLNFEHSTALAFLAVAFFCTSAFGADAEVGIPKTVPYAQGVEVPDAVKNECQLGEKVSEFLLHDASVKVSDNPNEGRYLDMSITEVFAQGGGAWSGPKWMTVTGTLMENGKKVASFRAKRFSTGGAFGGFKGTCAIIGRCTKTIAEDIAKWLKNPVDGAQLGDAKSG